MVNVVDTLRDRGFIEQMTHDQETVELFSQNKVTCYIGFDPTGTSLHIGHLLPIMALAHMQKHGHRPIALVGGGTGLIGDPSGKTEMRKMLTLEQVAINVDSIKQQLARFIDFSNDKALMENNADWLTRLQYIPFLRDIGRNFSVNRMIKAESCRNRLESEDGLSFIEFNYMVLQAYDYLELHRRHGCRLQMGGSDQWGNIVAGIDLVRRMQGDRCYGITFPLITTSSGAKMGKTAAGAVWLDPQLTSPYDYYQFWINTDDRDVIRFLKLFTFLPLKEIDQAAGLSGVDLNQAKTVLAFDGTLLAHGFESAVKAHLASVSMFGARPISRHILASSRIHELGDQMQDAAVPTTILEYKTIKDGIPAYKLFHLVGLAKSGGEARRLLNQGGGYVNGSRLRSADTIINDEYINEMEIVLRSGKKKFHKIQIK